jgi:hypothetical protein
MRACPLHSGGWAVHFKGISFLNVVGRMLLTVSPQEFVARLRYASLKERSATQSHFGDLCRLLGEQTRIETDREV